MRGALFCKLLKPIAFRATPPLWGTEMNAHTETLRPQEEEGSVRVQFSVRISSRVGAAHTLLVAQAVLSPATTKRLVPPVIMQQRGLPPARRDNDTHLLGQPGVPSCPRLPRASRLALHHGSLFHTAADAWVVNALCVPRVHAHPVSLALLGAGAPNVFSTLSSPSHGRGRPPCYPSSPGLRICGPKPRSSAPTPTPTQSLPEP